MPDLIFYFILSWSCYVGELRVVLHIFFGFLFHSSTISTNLCNIFNHSWAGLGDQGWTPMSGHSRAVTCLAISGDGLQLLSGTLYFTQKHMLHMYFRSFCYSKVAALIKGEFPRSSNPIRGLMPSCLCLLMSLTSSRVTCLPALASTRQTIIHS